MKKDNYYYDPIMQPAIDYEKRKVMKEKLFERLGQIKVWGDVARYYLSLAQFVLILWGFLEVMKYDTTTTLLIIVGSIVGTIVLVFFHVRYIMPHEYAYLNRKDKMKIETLDRIKKIEEDNN